MNLTETACLFVGIVVVTGNVVVLVPRYAPKCSRSVLIRIAVVMWAVAIAAYIPVRVVPRSRFLKAAARGHVREVARLLAEDPSLVHARGFRDYTALHHAARNKQVNMVAYLVDHGADMDADGFGGTPLGLAVFHGHYECVRTMLEKGVDVNQRSMAHGNTAVHIAAFHGHAEIVRLLIEHGADVTLPDRYGNGTPLSDAKSEEIRDLLRSSGAVE